MVRLFPRHSPKNRYKGTKCLLIISPSNFVDLVEKEKIYCAKEKIDTKENSLLKCLRYCNEIVLGFYDNPVDKPPERLNFFSTEYSRCLLILDNQEDSNLDKMNKTSKLLIIDDNKEILDALYDFLRKKKYDVIPASNGLEGLKLIENEKQGFDLVITDLIMPDISGVALISIIKKKYPDTRVIAITGWGEHPEALATEAEADHVLEKPFELADLEKLIKNLLS